jgi:hypothetical protein
MPFCRICGEYYPENDMATEDICIHCNKTINHNNQVVDEDDLEDET